MKRYLRLYAHFLRFSFSRSLEFRVDFFFRIFMDLTYYAVSFGFFHLLFNHTTLLGDWNEAQVKVFIAAFIFIDAFDMTVFASNLWWLPVFVNKGDLDYYLVRPVSSLFFLTLRNFAANSFFNLLFALGILVFMLTSYPEPLSLIRIFIFLFLLINGVCLSMMMRLLLILPCFWTGSPRGLDELYWNLQEFGERPDSLFKGAIRRFFVWGLPIFLISSYPTRFLFSSDGFILLAQILLMTGFFALLTLFFWRLALKSYSSASS